MRKRMTDVVIGIRHTPSSSSRSFQISAIGFSPSIQAIKLALNRLNERQVILEAAPPPPRTVICVLGVRVAFPICAVGRNELCTAEEVDCRHFLNSFLQEFLMQLIGFVAGRINACEFGKDLVNLLILPTCALTGTVSPSGFIRRLSQPLIAGVEVLQNTSGRPVSADLVVALTTVNVPSSVLLEVMVQSRPNACSWL